MDIIEQIDSFGSNDGDSDTEEILTDYDDLDKSTAGYPIPTDCDDLDKSTAGYPISTDCDDLDKSIPIDHDDVSADVTDQAAISTGTVSQQRIVARTKGQVSEGQKSKLATCSFPQGPLLIIVDLEGKYNDDELSALLEELTLQYPDGKPDTVHAKTMFLLSELPRPFLF